MNSTIYTILTGETFSIKNSISSNILSINNTSGDEIFKISPEGKIYYKLNGLMKEVKIQEDIVEAFSYIILNYSGNTPDEILIDKYINKILENKRSNEYIAKIESAIRKIKIEKLNK